MITTRFLELRKRRRLMITVSFAIVCCVCVFTAPASFNFQGVDVPLGLSRAGYENWAADNPNTVMCDFPFSGPCNVGQEPNTPMTKAQAIAGARQDYPSYAQTFLSPPAALMVKTGLWLELEAMVGLICVIAAWLLGWTAIGAWRAVTRDT